MYVSMQQQLVACFALELQMCNEISKCALLCMLIGHLPFNIVVTVDC